MGGEDDEGDGGVGAGGWVVHELVAHDARGVEIYVFVIVVEFFVLPILREESYESKWRLMNDLFFLIGQRLRFGGFWFLR